MNQRISNEAILAIAVNNVQSDYERMIPLAWQISFAQALARADEAVRLARRDFSRRGGRRRKSDALQKEVEHIFRANPNITQREFFHKRNQHAIEGVNQAAPFKAPRQAGD